MGTFTRVFTALRRHRLKISIAAASMSALMSLDATHQAGEYNTFRTGHGAPIGCDLAVPNIGDVPAYPSLFYILPCHLHMRLNPLATALQVTGRPQCSYTGTDMRACATNLQARLLVDAWIMLRSFTVIVMLAPDDGASSRRLYHVRPSISAY